MAESKLIIGANEMTQVIYIGSNLKAEGGKKKKQKRYLEDKRSDFTYDVLGRQMHEKQIIVGKYHVKNYRQRNKKRRNVIKELIESNFQPGKCMMITLTFRNEQNKEDNTQNDNSNEAIPNIGNDNEYDYSPYIDFENYDQFKNLEAMEFDLVKISNDLFSPKTTADENNSSIEAEFTGGIYSDLKTCNKEFKKFIQKMNYRYENFKYVAAVGRQDNGNWHYHVVCNLSYIDFNELKKIWGLGGAFIGKIRSNAQLCKATSYVGKNMHNARLELKGQKGYLASKGLNRKIVLRSWADKEKSEFAIQNERLKESEENGIKYTKKHIVEHTYTGLTRDSGIFVEEKECKCTFKYYTYPIKSKQYFKFLDAAKRKQSR